MREHEKIEILKADFHQEMLRLCEVTKRLRLRGSVFCRKIQEKGGFIAAREWLSEGYPWTESQLNGFTQFLLAGGQIEDTVEAVVLWPRFESLYEESIRDRARARLENITKSEK